METFWFENQLPAAKPYASPRIEHCLLWSMALANWTEEFKVHRSISWVREIICSHHQHVAYRGHEFWTNAQTLNTVGRLLKPIKMGHLNPNTCSKYFAHGHHSLWFIGCIICYNERGDKVTKKPRKLVQPPHAASVPIYPCNCSVWWISSLPSMEVMFYIEWFNFRV